MRWEPLAGVLRFDLHMARLENSARELNFACNMDVIRQKIAESGTGDQALKLRLTLAPDGVATVAALPYEALPQQTVWRIAIARTRLDHTDPLLRYKTTRRQAYIAAREEYSPAEVDEVILLNERRRGLRRHDYLHLSGHWRHGPHDACTFLRPARRRDAARTSGQGRGQ